MKEGAGVWFFVAISGNFAPCAPLPVIVGLALFTTFLCSGPMLAASDSGSAAAADSAGKTLLDKFRAGPMGGVNEFVFASRNMNDTDGHWYANIGYYAHDPARKAWREGTKLFKWNLATGPNDRIDVYATERKYWESLWYARPGT